MNNTLRTPKRNVWWWIMCLCFLPGNILLAQNHVEYFWNTDPGVGKGTLITIANGSANIDIPTGQLPNGANLLGIRALNGQHASATMLRMVFKPFLLADDARIEYFWDTDPGIGMATAIPVSFERKDTALSFALPTEGLAGGMHLLGLRVNDGMHWSQTRTYVIAVAPKGGKVDCIEYFWDEDPGVGLATRYPIQASGNEVTISFDILTEGLKRGVHTLGIRSHCGGWSQTLRRMVVVGADDNPIEAVEYFWDEDPGYGQATPLAFTGGNVAMVNQEIDTPSDYGTHMLLIRAKAGGMWGTPYVQYLCINADPDFDLPKDTVCVGEQFIVTNLTTGATEATTYNWDMNNDGIADYTSGDNFIYSYTKAGNYIASLAVKTVGTCETTIFKTIVVLDTTAPSVTLSASAKTACSGDSIRFKATSSNGGDSPEYEWLINGNVVATGTADTLWVDTLADYSTVQVRVISSNPCASVDNALSSKLTIRVNELPEISLAHYFPLYTSESAVILAGGMPEGGTYYIDGKEAQLFNPKRNEAGSYRLSYSYTDSEGCTSEAVTTLQLREGTLLLGDVNKDEAVDVMDVLCEVDLVYGRTFPTYTLATADINGDNTINVADIVGVSGIILGNHAVARAFSLQHSARQGSASQHELSASDAYANGGVTEVQLQFNLSPSAAVSGLQFDVTLPEGVTLTSATQGVTVGRKADATDNTYTLLAYSASLGSVPGTLAVQASLPVNMTEGVYPIMPENVVLVDAHMNMLPHTMKGGRLLVGQPTGMGHVADGVHVDVTESGLHITGAAGSVAMLTDAAGRFVQAEELPDNDCHISLSSLSAGIYVVEIENEHAPVKVKFLWK